MLLAIDTATDFAGLALYDVEGVWAEEVWFAARNHTVTLMPRLNQMLASIKLAKSSSRLAAQPASQFDPSSLEGIVVSLGPGSYTGVRIAVAIAKGLALPHQKPVVGIPTLQVTAYPHRTQTQPVVAIVQAGRKRLLAAQFAQVNGKWGQTISPKIYTIQALIDTVDQPVLLSGELRAEDIAYIKASHNPYIQLAEPFERVRRPSILAHLGKLQLDQTGDHPLHQLEPIYLNEP